MWRYNSSSGRLMLSSSEDDTDYTPDNSLLDYIPEEATTAINNLSAALEKGTLGMESEASSSYGMVNGNGSVFDDSDSFFHADPSQQSDVSHSHQEPSDMIGRDEDGLLSHENEELRERVSTLEKRVQQQEDDILCLKSALSDALRRVTSLESSKGLHNNVLPSKPNFRSPKKPLTSTPYRESSNRRSTSNDSMSARSLTSPVPNRVVPRGSTGGSSRDHSLKKWPSVPSHDSASSGNITPGRRSFGSMSSLNTRSPLLRAKDPGFSADEGILRMYLRGRAVNMYAPTNVGEYQVNKPGVPPTDKLKLEWAYGYRGRDTRNNLYLLPTGEMVYFIASVVVLYNVDEHMQRHYLGHTDDIKCLAVHPGKITIATGQVAGHDKREGRRTRQSNYVENPELMPHIRIWDSVSLNTLHIIGLGDFERAVCCVAFSKIDGGKLLCAVDEANEHIISVWDWQKGEKGHKITETKSSTEAVLAAEFHPCDKVIVSCGKSLLAFWSYDGDTLSKKTAIFEKHDKPKFVSCIAFAENGDLISGDSNGNLFVWSRGSNRVSHSVVGAHEGGIFSVCVLKDGIILTGGKDRRIVEWSASYAKTGQEHEIPEHFGSVRMLSQGKGNMVLVGTTRSVILQGTLQLNFSAIVQGHMDELWGLSAHPSQNQFVTTGYDKNLYLWDSLTHTAVWQKDLPDGAHCACFHPDGNILVVGTCSARWLVIDVNTRDIISTHTDGNEQLECIMFAPDGRHLAIGSRDNYIYIYSVSDNCAKFNRVGKCSGHSSFVTHIDWSADGQYLQSNSGDYELLFWNAQNCRQMTNPSQLRDLEWATHTCTLGFNVCGIWPEGADGTDVNACARSHKDNLVASADDFGKVNLYQYPSCVPKSTGHIYGGHSSHVTNVRFLHDDSRLLSTGGKDMAILQWQIV